MSQEVKSITQQQIGFGYSIYIEKELRSETGAKYPDKTVIKAELSGHADTPEQASTLLDLARQTIQKQLEAAPKPAEAITA